MVELDDEDEDTNGRLSTKDNNNMIPILSELKNTRGKVKRRDSGIVTHLKNGTQLFSSLFKANVIFGDEAELQLEDSLSSVSDNEIHHE